MHSTPSAAIAHCLNWGDENLCRAACPHSTSGLFPRLARKALSQCVCGPSVDPPSAEAAGAKAIIQLASESPRTETMERSRILWASLAGINHEVSVAGHMGLGPWLSVEYRVQSLAQIGILERISAGDKSRRLDPLAGQQHFFPHLTEG